MNVLITGCSRHSKELVDCLKNNEDGVKVGVVGVDCNELNILRTNVDKFAIVPPITHPGYIDTLLELCYKNDVDVILPYITAELGLLAANRNRIEAEGVKVSVASTESLAVANNKVALAGVFPELMPEQTVAHTGAEVYAFADKIGYSRGNTFCCKLSNKCGGAGFAVVDEGKALDITTFNRLGVNRYMKLAHIAEVADTQDVDIILQRYIPGLDYSVSVLADHGEIVQMCGFAGYAMEYGAVTSGEILKNDSAYAIAEKVVSEIGLDGNACLDFIIDKDGKPWLLEINPRINATLPFLARAGLNLAYLRCRQLMGFDVSGKRNIEYGLRMGKFYESYYYRTDI